MIGSRTRPPRHTGAARDAAADAPRAARAADPTVVVRPATIADLDTVVDLRLALLREHRGNPLYEHLRPDAPARARRLFAAQIRSPDDAILLAEREGRVVGILRCVKTGGLPLLYPDTHAYVSSVYVLPAERQRGTLRALLDAAIAWAKARGLFELRLHSAVDNAAANAAWEALGFRIAEHLRIRRLH